MQVKAFAQTDLPPSSSKPAGISTESTIDHLDDISYKIYLENPDSARKIAEKALLMAEKAQYPLGIGRSFLNIGYVYWSQSYYPIALYYLNSAMMNLPKNKPLFIADCYNITGRTYAELGNYQKAFDNLAKAEQFAFGDVSRVAETYSERSYVYLKLKKFDEAIQQANHCLLLNRIAKNLGNIGVAYARLSDIYTQQQEAVIALPYSDMALQLSLTVHNNRLRAHTYVEYALIYNQLRQFDKAITYAQQGVALADSIGVVDAASEAYGALVDSYEQQKDLSNAMAFQRKYNNLRDSLNKFDKVKNTELIQSYFALNTRLNAIASVEHDQLENKEKIQAQREVIIILAMSLLIMVTISSATWYFYKQKKQLSEQLNEQNEALQKQKQLIEAQTANLELINKVKDKLLAVIGHDLRSPLANLKNITEMFEADYLSTEEVNWIMKDINPVIKSAELTLSNLMEWAGSHIKGRSINSSRLDIFLLGVEMEQTFTHALHRKSIEFVNRATAGQSVTADENHIKVVLRNLISNAIKFTDPNGYIILNSNYEESQVIICIQDTGKGMSEEEIGKLFVVQTHFSQPGTQGESGTGIGLLLCKELVELNGGRLWITSEPGKGSKFYFSLPLNTEYAS